MFDIPEITNHREKKMKICIQSFYKKRLVFFQQFYCATELCKSHATSGFQLLKQV